VVGFAASGDVDVDDPRGKSPEHFQTWFQTTLGACEAGRNACSRPWIAPADVRSELPAFTRCVPSTGVLRSAAHGWNRRLGALGRTSRRSC